MNWKLASFLDTDNLQDHFERRIWSKLVVFLEGMEHFKRNSPIGSAHIVKSRTSFPQKNSKNLKFYCREKIQVVQEMKSNFIKQKRLKSTGK